MLKKSQVEVFYDNRREKKISPGVKFKDFELLGIPYQIVLSEKLLSIRKVEIWYRKTGEKQVIKIKELKAEMFK